MMLNRVSIHLSVILLCAGASLLRGAPPEGYGTIELLRDRWGVPNVYSETDAGALYGLGYACAEDRLFQMCYSRLILQGRVAEIFGDLEGLRGKTALGEDRLMRILGFYRSARRAAESLDGDTRSLLEAYSRGVNDSIEAHREDLHYLFKKFEFTPEPWTPADCIASWWHLAKFFGTDGLRDLLPGTERPEVPGRPEMRPARPVIDDDAAVVRREDVTGEWIEKTHEFMRRHGLDPEKGETRGPEEPKFSHAWIIGGKKTTTGAAVLVSDPQTPVWNPSMLYEFHLAGKTFNARGAGVPGSPLILIGFNRHVSWGMTALGADQADLFILKTDEAHPNQYQLDGEWHQMDVREEVIRLKGGDSLNVTVRETRFGPVVSEFIPRLPPGMEVAVKRIPLAEADRETIQGAIAMMRAKSAREFGEALAGWRFPSANCIFGDRSGDIGYWTIGAIPLRSAASNPGNAAHDGSTSATDWQAMIPHELLPHVLNPRRGYLVTANHRTIQSFYRLTLGTSTGANGDTLRGLRIKQRIAEHLAKKESFTPEEVLAIQNDAVNACKREILRCGYHIRDVLMEYLNPPALQALKHLEPWYRQGAASDLRIPGTELADEMRFVFRAGRFPLARVYGGGDSGAALFAKTVKALLDKDPRAELSKDERSFVNTVLSTGWLNASRRYGGDPALWNFKARAAIQNQALGYYSSLDGYPSLDPDQDVKLPFLPVTDGSTILSQRAQAYTQFVPLHDPDRALTILPFGQSERPGSPFRFSTWADWSAGVLHPAPLSRNAVTPLAVQSRRLSALPKSTARPAPREERRRRRQEAGQRG